MQVLLTVGHFFLRHLSRIIFLMLEFTIFYNYKLDEKSVIMQKGNIFNTDNLEHVNKYEEIEADDDCYFFPIHMAVYRISLNS